MNPLLSITVAVFMFVIDRQPSFPAQPAEMRKVFISHAAVSTGSIPLVAAEANGYYRAEGLITQRIMMEASTSVRAVLSGSVEFATDMSSSLEAAVRGPKLKVLMVFGDRPIEELVARPPIRSFSDLIGKTVGVSSLGSASDMVTRTILLKNGLQPEKDVFIRALGTPGVRLVALKNGSIDASLLTPPPSFLATRDMGLISLARASDYLQSLQGGVISVADVISNSPDMVFRFVRATLKGFLFYRAKREPSVALLLDKLRLPDREIAERIYDFHRSRMTPDATVPISLAQTVIEDRSRAAKVSRPRNPEEIFDFSIAKRAMADLQATGWQP
jgi:NitT/TauT family transport system substrate-binding protein